MSNLSVKSSNSYYSEYLVFTLLLSRKKNPSLNKIKIKFTRNLNKIKTVLEISCNIGQNMFNIV